MRIAFLINDLAGSGGVERVVINSANSFQELLNYQVGIISLFPTNRSSYIELSRNINHYKLSRINKSNKFSKYIDIIRMIRKIVMTENYNILICTSVSQVLLCLPLKIFKSGIKVVAWEHSQYDNASVKIKLLRKVLYRFVDLIVTLTKHDCEIFEKHNDNTVRIPNYIETDYKLKSDSNSKKIISVGRLEYEKGYDLLIKAFRVVHKKHSDWKLDIYGEGSLRSQLATMIKEYNLENVINLKGFKNNIEEIYSKYSIFILSSRTESFGMVLLEAMSNGLACISYDCKIGPKEIINHDIDGRLVETENVESLSEEIINLIENKEKRIILGNNAVVKSKYYSKDTVMNKWRTELLKLK